MKIVVTHINPDFDALASAYAALLLHDADHIAIISKYDAEVSEYIKNSPTNLPIKRYTAKEIEEITALDELIITDCKQRNRIGQFSQLLDISKKVIVYDHHPEYQADIMGDIDIVKQIGSTTTIISRILQEKKFTLTPDQATLFTIGIYVDTGILTFNATTSEDALAVAYLIDQGADLSIVSDVVKRDLNSTQVFILNDLLQNLSFITVGGVSIAVTHAIIDEYYEDVATIAHRLMMIEALDSLFILIQTGGRVVLVGRSRNSRVDVSEIVTKFGGGGHTSAGSAIIKDLMLQEAMELLKLSITEQIKTVRLAKDIMTSPVKFVTSTAILKDALDITMKYNLNNMPVLKNNKTIGIISRKDLLYALKHGLDNEPITMIMNSEFDTISPDTPYMVAQEIIVSKGYKILPIEDDNQILGVLTRTDILRLLSNDISINNNNQTALREYTPYGKLRNIKNMLDTNLPIEIKDIILKVKALADEKSINVYIVGGFVRDLMMGKDIYDLDFVIESADTICFATEFAILIDARISVHDNYKTASVILPNKNKIDFATARTEYYMTPGALPTVEEASIRNDLFRRDFTINTMAIRLDGKYYGELIDYFIGQKDIKDKKIRVLHSLSFIDDPTRVFRAIRFAVRFDFDIGSHTERLIKHAVSINIFDRIVGLRLFTELKLILKEPSFIPALHMLKHYNILSFFHDQLTITDLIIEHYNRLAEVVSWYTIEFKQSNIQLWKMRFYILISQLTTKDLHLILKKIEIPEKILDGIKTDFNNIKYAKKIFKKMKTIKPSDIFNICKQISTEATIVLSVILSDLKLDIAKDYLKNYRYIKLDINGNDLKYLGITQGEIYKTILTDLLVAKLDGIVNNYDEEIEYVKTNYLSEIDIKSIDTK